MGLPALLMAWNFSEEARYGTAVAKKAAKASKTAALRLKKSLVKAAQEIVKTAGLHAADYLSNGLIDDSQPTAANSGHESLTVWDVHTPEISTSASSITLEARNFGGLWFSRAYDDLHSTLSYSDPCGRPVSVSNDAPKFLGVGTTTPITWTVRDAGPYPAYVPDHASITQMVTVLDTQPPLLVPPAGFARESSTPIDLTTGAFSLGSVLVSDLADPAPTLTTDAPGVLDVNHRYVIHYTATDASGNSTVAPAGDPERYAQVVTIKAPGTNTAPTAAPATAQTLTSKPVTVTLAGNDNDVLDGRVDPLEFKIVDRPANGEFVAPLFPFFIDDYRQKPAGTPGSADPSTLACPANPSDGSELSGKLGLLEPGDHYTYLSRCYCGSSVQIPRDFIYEPQYVHITDKDERFVSDHYWACNVTDAELHGRISKFVDGEFKAEWPVNDGFEGVFQVDADGNLWTLHVESGGSSTYLAVTGLSGATLQPLAVPANGAVYDYSSAPLISSASLVNAHIDPERGVIYVNDKTNIFMFDYANPKTLLGTLNDGNGFLRDCEGTTGYSRGGYWMDTDSEGNLYQVCGSRVHKFGPPPLVDGVRAPGPYIGWLGKCTANLADPQTGVKYNYCDEAAQASKGFQCTDATCARATTTGSGPWDPLESTCRHASLSIL